MGRLREAGCRLTAGFGILECMLMSETGLILPEPPEGLTAVDVTDWWVNRVFAVHLERYESAEAVTGAYAEIRGENPEPFIFGGKAGTHDRAGTFVPLTAGDGLDGSPTIGLVGFCDLLPKTTHPEAGSPVIHYWRNPDPDAGPFVGQGDAYTFFAEKFRYAVLYPRDLIENGKHQGDMGDRSRIKMIRVAIALRAQRLSKGEGEPAPGE